MPQPLHIFQRVPDQYPWFINLSVTTRCNLSCEMCGSKNAGVPDLPTERWLRYIDRLGAWLPKPRVVIVSGGEPLMRDDALQLMDRLTDVGFAPQITTNGTMLDIERVHRLARAGRDAIILSLHGVGESNDRLRNAPGHYQGVLDMLHYMSAHTELGLHVTAVINALTGVEMPELVRRMAAIPRFGRVHFQAIVPTFSRPWSNDFFRGDPLWPRGANRLATMLDVLSELEQMKREGWPINNPPSQFMMWRRYFRDPVHAFEHVPCAVGDDNLLAMADGRVLFCDHLGTLGTIDDDPHVLWESPEASRLREEMRLCKRPCNYRVNCCYVDE